MFIAVKLLCANVNQGDMKEQSTETAPSCEFIK